MSIFLRCNIYLFIMFVSFVMFLFDSYADTISGHFLVTQKEFNFSKSTKDFRCTGQIPYPFLSHENGEMTTEINEEISDFLQKYQICNKDNEPAFAVMYDIPLSGSNDYLSIRWITTQEGKLYRIDCLNFDVNNENILTIDDIFNDMSESVVGGLAKLSGGLMSGNINWEGFLNMIGKREIQFYLKNNEWYIVFNGTNKVVEAKIPKYFLENQ